MRLHSVPIATLCLFLEAIGAHPHEDISRLAHYAGKSASTARRALPTLEELGLVRRDEAGRYAAQSDRVKRGVDESHLRQLIRRALFTFRPFEVICEGISLGESEAEAIRKSMALLAVDPADEPSIKVLIRWGEELDILTRRDGRLTLSEDVDFQHSLDSIGLPTPDDVSSEAKARLYAASRLGIDAHNYLDEVDRTLLAEAILEAHDSPEDSLESAGKAVENFLREVASDKGLGDEASKKNGAAQVATLLRSRDVIHPHHIHLVQAVSTLRNSQGHSKDKVTKEVWQADTRTAYWSAHGSLIAIRSIYEYVFNNRHIL